MFYNALEFLLTKYASSASLYAYVKLFDQRPPPSGQELSAAEED
jgi:hypothetical protein